nr:GRAS transcription factor 27 [Rheum palmatum]
MSPDSNLPPPAAFPPIGPDVDEPGCLRLLTLLLQCAECVAVDNLADATVLLLQISELSSPFGSPPERVIAYFSDALRVRIIGSCLPAPAYRHLSKTLALAQMHKFHSAFQSYNSISPLVKFSHFTANQAIYQALDGEDRVHVIDLDVMQGLQWPGLFHILATRPRRIASLRLTGIGSSAELLHHTGRRLAEFATSLGIHFEFRPLEGKIGELTDPATQLGLLPGEATVVHWIRHSLYDVVGSEAGALSLLQLIRPKVITVVEQELRRDETTSFLGCFVEALHYYSALFDAVGVAAGGDSLERHQVEHQIFGREIRNVLGFGVPNRWADQLLLAGFRPISLAGGPAAQANMLLGMFPWNWRGYSLVEDNGCLKLGWKDLPLLTASAWHHPDPES